MYFSVLTETGREAEMRLFFAPPHTFFCQISLPLLSHDNSVTDKDFIFWVCKIYEHCLPQNLKFPMFFTLEIGKLHPSLKKTFKSVRISHFDFARS